MRELTTADEDAMDAFTTENKNTQALKVRFATTQLWQPRSSCVKQQCPW